MTTPEQTQLEAWDKTYCTKYIKQFPLRIQRTLENITLADIDPPIESTFIWGRNGSGKTTLAARMALCERKLTFLDHTNKDFLFINTAELLLEFRDTYHNPHSDVTELDVLQRYTRPHLLVLDDLGVERTTDWSFQMLYILINRRYESMSKTIVTANMNLSELASKFGDDRIPGRLQQMCRMIHMKDKNYRYTAV